MKHETAWNDRAGNPSSCQQEVAVLAVRSLHSDEGELDDKPRVTRLWHVQILLTVSAGFVRHAAICRTMTGKQSR